ncbi:DUF2809 domain-containing protein [Microbacterium trichothecenolyticum]|uniref:Small-conductance mechanosensitive channel n=1 Tax=Microbacterium trichothecenolyticum TaxID=69370 RepID=A0ABU0TSA6_MICTR|nr:DUF2809 domain-containing protein [Microbacterium trichothecenolyticum]MDQ1122553.1 small-conductance mechanosensitive channel [Microbacterium trichothecenolyticum]
MTLGRRRVVALGALVVVVAAGLVVARVLPDAVATDVAGDALYAVALYAALVVVWPRGRCAVRAAVAATWCAGIELLQLTPLPRDLAAHVPPVALVLGSGFDVRDLVVYALAIGAAAVLDARVSALLFPRGKATHDVGSSD